MAETQTKKKKSSNLEVLCRIRPYNGEQPAVQIVGEDKVKLVPPPEVPLNRRGEPSTESIYKFAHVFESHESQRAVFEKAGLDLVENLVMGVNSLLFTYGVTGSGKTFTMAGAGHGDNSGIIPRSVDVLFNSVKNLQDKCVFAPNGRNGFYIRSVEEALLARSRLKPPEYSMTERVIESKKVYGFNRDMTCSVFMSYVEIYNDNCYDLLDESLGENRLNMVKNIRTDIRGVNFVEKVCEIEVSSSDEVLEQYIKAQERRKVARTLLNELSSRSHSVFTIRLVMAPLDNDGMYPVADESQIIVSQLCLVDLAGSERSKRTDNQGQRLVETGKINQSLLVLRRCFEQLRENQRIQRRNGAELTVPYREQKLTLLFKSYFEGHGKIRMIVCVNPRPSDYEENIFVMSFAELAQVVDVPESSVPAPLLCDLTNQRYSRRDVNRWYAELDKRLDGVNSSSVVTAPPPPIQCIDYNDESSIISLREYYTSADRMRVGKLSSMKMNEADMNKMLLERLCSADLDRRMIDELETERDELREYNSSISSERNKLRRELTTLQVRLGRFESEVMNQRRRDEDERRRQAEQSQVLMKQRETMKTIAAGLNIAPTAPTGRVAALTNMFSTDENKPPQPSKGKQYVRGPGGNYYNPAAALVKPVGRGFANNRYGKRRSRSLGGRVLNHQPINKIPTGTVFQPEFPLNTKHTTKVKAEDLKTCTDYIITNQAVDEGGNLSTQHFKGDIVPTAAGGHSVMFRDVERLTQESP